MDGCVRFHDEAIVQSTGPLPSQGIHVIEVCLDACSLDKGTYIGVVGARSAASLPEMLRNPQSANLVWAVQPWQENMFVDRLVPTPDQARTVDHMVARIFTSVQRSFTQRHGLDIASSNKASRRVAYGCERMFRGGHRYIDIDDLMNGHDFYLNNVSPSQSLASNGLGRGLVFTEGDRLLIQVDMDARTLQFLRNGKQIPGIPTAHDLPEHLHVFVTGESIYNGKKPRAISHQTQGTGSRSNGSETLPSRHVRCSASCSYCCEPRRLRPCHSTAHTADSTSHASDASQAMGGRPRGPCRRLAQLCAAGLRGDARCV